ncbi:tumor necrosis factor receptor superfamily member 1B [Elgaria multicarinata webbii]|uniref:tumor necrosis factor receptor superfamily member 1B n=1 Tax=Elgaria multicarinata webbii TaxID=159646 RepID=UPI002FCD1AC5
MWRRRRSAGLLCSALQLALLQVYSLPYTPQHQEKCQHPKMEYYNETINKCCSLCRPGYRVLQRCSASVDTMCTPCEDGMHTDIWSRAVRCFSCNPECTGDLVEVKQCNRTQNRECWCQPHQFCASEHSGECLQCQAYKQCKKGYGVKESGTRSSDVQCAPCTRGTFSDVESHSATCRPHRICKSELLPGNSTSDAICSDSSGSSGIIATSPRITITGKGPLPPQHEVTTIPMLNSKQDLSTDVSSIAGWVAGVMLAILILIGGTFFSFALRKKGQHCAPLCGNEKQSFSGNMKVSGSWPQASSTLKQEEQNLLQVSTSSGSLDSPPGSNKSSGISNVSTLTIEAEKAPERSSPSSTCMHHNGAKSKQSSNGGTHVNVSCIVSVCNSDHSLQFQSLNGSVVADSRDCALAAEDLPLSKEESPLKREPGRQIAVEVEDNTDIFDHEGKPLPLSIQDVGMKTT